MIEKVSRIVRESGVSGLLARAVAFVYRRAIRPLLPVTGPALYAGLPIHANWRLGDRVVPKLWRPLEVADEPEYEVELVRGLRQYVEPGDRVVVVGGGVGVTAVVAAMQAGPAGRVTCFEGAAEGVSKVRQTAKINGVADRLVVEHAVVARSIAVYGTEPHGAVLPPAELPGCDVLELDCEGAEVEILREMTIQPRTILVETHGCYGAPTELVVSLLHERRYRTEMLSRFTDENDIAVVAAVRADVGDHAPAPQGGPATA